MQQTVRVAAVQAESVWLDLAAGVDKVISLIGEAAAGLSDGFISQHPGVPWRQIIATRNRVVHGLTRFA